MTWLSVLPLSLPLLGIVGAALALGGGALASGVGSYLSGQNQSDAIRKAMQQYLDYRQGQRNTFLSQPEAQTVKGTLGDWAGGKTGFDPSMMEGMKSNYYEDYGKGLADIARMAPAAGVNPGGTYTPGRSDRVTRIMGENVATRRAEGIRGINQANMQQANSNARFAASALPTYLPGDPGSGVVTDPNVFTGLNNPGPDFAGTMLSSLGGVASQAGGQMLANQYPDFNYNPYGGTAGDAIRQKMLGYGRRDPYSSGGP